MDQMNYKILKAKFIPQGTMATVLNFMQLENKLKILKKGYDVAIFLKKI